MEHINDALLLMLYGVSGVFAVLFIFFGLTKCLNLVFPSKNEEE